MRYKKLLALAMACGLLITGCGLNDVKQYISSTFSSDDEDGEATLDEDYYFDLEDSGEITETDYLDWASYYEDLGDTANERLVLIKVHTLYPSDEYVDMISSIPVEITEETQSYLITTSMDAAIGGLMDVAMETVESEEFKDCYLEQLVGVRRHSIYYTNDGQFDVYADDESTDIIYHGYDETYRQLYYDSTGAYIFQTSLLDNQYNGDFTFEKYSSDKSLQVFYSGNLSNGVCTGDFNIQFDSYMYTGSFDEEGHTTVTQVDSVTSAGNVIYVYDKNQVAYLYTEGTVDTFTITPEFLGVKEE